MGISNNFWIALRGALGGLRVKTADAEQLERELRAVAEMPPRGTDFTPFQEELTRSNMVGNISYPAAVQRYTLGRKVWAKDESDPLMQEANRAVGDAMRKIARMRDEEEEFTAESLASLLSDWKVSCARLEVALAKLQTGDAMRTNARRGKDQGSTADARSRPTAGQPIQTGARPLVGLRSSLFDASRTRAYQQSLMKGREATTDQVAPAKVVTAADYAATLAAGRKRA